MKSSSDKRRSNGGRHLKVKVKTARGRKLSSTLWLQRQLNDPYVIRATQEGYRSRAAFKLLEIDEKHPFLQPGALVVDLGAAPGGWSQVAAKKVGKNGHVIALDLQEIESLENVTCIQGDFYDDAMVDEIIALLDGRKANVVLTDMAASSSGHHKTDHLKIMGLVEGALDFALDILAPEGVFLAKVLQGGTENELLTTLKQRFKTVKHIKPPASRKDSSEMYVLAMGFKS